MSFFEKNMASLRKRNPALAGAVSETPVPNSFSVLKSSSGASTLFWNSPPARPRYLHSPVDPDLEARGLLEGRIFKKQDGTFLIGLGLGYLAKEIVRKKEPRHLLCIAEAIPGLFRLALEHSDLRDVIEDEETHWFIGNEITRILDGFSPLNLKAISGEFNRITLPAFVEIYGGFYEKTEARLHEHLNSLRHSFHTFLKTRETSLTSLLRNVPHMISSQAANSLAGLIKGRPAIIVAAGPSLSDDIETLRDCRSGCFLISVDAALKPLLGRGIVPDLAITCDSQSMSFKKIEGLSRDLLCTIPLLFSSSAFPSVVEPFGGLKFVSDTENSLSRWLLSRGRKVDGLPCSGTVSHLAFTVAAMMGADPVIFAGLDLAFPRGDAHAEGCTSPWTVGTEIRDFPSVSSNNGSPVKTCVQFISMIKRFENDIERAKTTCINVSRGGAAISGAPWMELCEAVPRGLDRTFDYKPLLETAFRRGFYDARDELRLSLQWLLSEASVMETLVCTPDASSSYGTDVGPLGACLERKPFLEILIDYFPQYLLSFNRIPKNGFPEPDRDTPSLCAEQASLFMKEAREILPPLRSGCVEAIHSLENTD